MVVHWKGLLLQRHVQKKVGLIYIPGVPSASKSELRYMKIIIICRYFKWEANKFTQSFDNLKSNTPYGLSIIYAMDTQQLLSSIPI